MGVKDKKKRNSSLAKRASLSYSSKDRGGGGSRVINWKDACGDVKFYQPAEGKNAINIIPFEIKSKKHPLVKQGQMEIGELDYCFDIWTHRNIGPSESSVICLKRNYGKACPVCEESEKMKKQGKEKEAAALTAKRRAFYNVEDVRKKPGELQVFEVSHYLFEKELIDEARNEEEGDDGFVDFADPKTGSVVKFRCSKSSQGGYEFNEFKSFTFAEREDAIDDDLLASAISFDEHLNVLTYEEVQAILYGSDEEEESEEDEEGSTRKKQSAKKPSKKTDDDDDEDEEDEDRSKKSAKKSAKKKSDEDEDEDEEEEKQTKKSSGKGKCPHGHSYGEDTDDYPDCEDCEVWVKCSGKKKRGD